MTHDLEERYGITIERASSGSATAESVQKLQETVLEDLEEQYLRKLHQHDTGTLHKNAETRLIESALEDIRFAIERVQNGYDNNLVPAMDVRKRVDQ